MTAFYTQYRPTSLADMQGQEMVRAVLSQTIEKQAFAHAYLFTGPRGTGKTTTARILARAIVRADLSPSHEQDIIEMDAASHTGVDNIRSLIEESGLTPLFAPNKVYIIDEVHMLTKQAFNALLKTLEEPPRHCYFILATTDREKVLPTIISRCQELEFRSLPLTGIQKKLQNIADDQQVVFEPEALHLIAQLADGGMRNAETLIEKVIAATVARSETVTAEQVSFFLGVAPRQDILAYLHAVFRGARHDGLTLIAGFREKNMSEKWMGDMVLEILESELVSESGEFASFSPQQLLFVLKHFVENARRFRQEGRSFLAWELTLLESEIAFCSTVQSSSIATTPAVAPSAPKVQKAPKEPSAVSAPEVIVPFVQDEQPPLPPEPVTSVDPSISEPSVPVTSVASQPSQSAPVSADVIFKQEWLRILNDAELPMTLKTSLKTVRPEVRQDTLLLHVPSDFAKKRFEKEEFARLIVNIVQKTWPNIRTLSAILDPARIATSFSKADIEAMFHES